MVKRILKTTLDLAIVVAVIMILASGISGAIGVAMENGYNPAIVDKITDDILGNTVDVSDENIDVIFDAMMKDMYEDLGVDEDSLDTLLFGQRTMVGVVKVALKLCFKICQFFSDGEYRFRILFVLFLWIYCVSAFKNSLAKTSTSMSYYVTGVADRFAHKVISFPKPAWFWGLCLITCGIPIFAPLAVYIILKCFVGIAKWIFAPIVYPVLSYYVAVTSTI